MEKFADMVSDDFLYRISRLKEEHKNYKSYESGEFEIVLILVNSSNKKCIIVEEKDLDNEIQERFDRIVLLLKHKSFYCGFTNTHFDFIGIFNKNNKESMIEYETIAIKKLKFKSAAAYDPYNWKYINSSELVFIYNPFSSYLKKVFSPIKKSIKMAVPKGVYPDVFEDIDDNFSFTCSHLMVEGMMYEVRDFEEYLKMIGEIDQKMSDLYYKKFNPDDYSD